MVCLKGRYQFFLGICKGFQKRRGNLESVVENERSCPRYLLLGEGKVVRVGGMEIHSRQQINLVQKCGDGKQLPLFCDSHCAQLPWLVH